MLLSTFLKACMQNVLQPQDYIKKLTALGKGGWKQLQLNTLWTLMNGIRKPICGCFTPTVTDHEKVRKCSVSRVLEPFTSCWSSYHLTYFLLLTPNSFKRVLSNLISIQRSLKFFWNVPVSDSFLYCLSFFFYTDIIRSSHQGRLPRSPCWIACQIGAHLLKIPLQMNQVESMQGARVFKGRAPSRERVSRAGRFFRESNEATGCDPDSY